MNKANYTICVVDNPGGSYLNTAICLAPYFKKTFYHSINFSAFPHPALNMIGTGYDEIERIDDFWSNLKEIDIIIFPDGGLKDMGAHLRSIGKMVFGGNEIETIEGNRSLFQELLERVDLPVAKTEVVIGVSNLKKTLKNKKDKWVKVSKWRNLIETYHYLSWTESKFWLDELTFKLGPIGDSEKIEFIIQDPIDSIAEIGCDGYVVGGKMPKNLIQGIEVKDMGYVGKVSNKIWEPIAEINTKFSPVLKAYASGGSFYSNEIRYTKDKTPYYTDIAARAGMPPSSSFLTNISNWDKIIPAACKGEFVEPIYKSTYMVEIILKSNYVREGYLPVTFPIEYQNNITFKGAMKVDGKTFIIPFKISGVDMVEFGSVVVNDNDLDNAINRTLEIAATIQAYELRYEIAAMDASKETIKRIEDALGIIF